MEAQGGDEMPPAGITGSWKKKTKGETRVLGGSKWDGEEPGDPLNWSPPPLVGALEILCWEC